MALNSVKDLADLWESDLRREMKRRRDNVLKHYETLKDKNSEYGKLHMRQETIYRGFLNVIDEHCGKPDEKEQT
jgi:hypothetical protein